MALYSKGAAEIILPMCTAQYQADGSKSELSEEDREAVLGYVGIGGNRYIQGLDVCLAWHGCSCLIV